MAKRKMVSQRSSDTEPSVRSKHRKEGIDDDVAAASTRIKSEVEDFDDDIEHAAEVDLGDIAGPSTIDNIERHDTRANTHAGSTDFDTDHITSSDDLSIASIDIKAELSDQEANTTDTDDDNDDEDDDEDDNEDDDEDDNEDDDEDNDDNDDAVTANDPSAVSDEDQMAASARQQEWLSHGFGQKRRPQVNGSSTYQERLMARFWRGANNKGPSQSKCWTCYIGNRHMPATPPDGTEETVKVACGCDANEALLEECMIVFDIIKQPGGDPRNHPKCAGKHKHIMYELCKMMCSRKCDTDTYEFDVDDFFSLMLSKGWTYRGLPV